MTPVRVLLIALLLAPLGLAACGDEPPPPVSRAEGEACDKAYEKYKDALDAVADAGELVARLNGQGDPALERAYLDARKAVLVTCTPRTFEFAAGGPDALGSEYSDFLKEYCDEADRYRETDLCEGVPQ